MPKKDRAFARNMRIITRKAGQRQYQRTVFHKYEKFFQDIGVSLERPTKTTPTVLRFDEKRVTKRKVAVSRNDTCACGSGKKYKKCCGA